MINFFKMFVNFLYFLFTLGLIALIAWGANAAVNIGGSNEDVPNLIKKESDSEDTIYFSDVFGFFGLSVQNAHNSHEVYINTGRHDEEKLWFIQMGWANRTISWTKNVFIAVFAPSYEIEQVEKYRNATLEYDGELVISINFNNEKYEDVPRWLKDGTEAWDNPIFKNTLSKYNKYNQIDENGNDPYEYYDKFMNNKSVVKWAFAEVILIVFLSFIVVYQNPIDFKQTNDGVTEMSKSFIPKFPKPRRRQKKNKRNKDRDKDKY